MQDPNDPYRSAQQRPETELERLAAEGRRRHEIASRTTGQAADREATYNLAVAIGAHFGTVVTRVITIVLCVTAAFAAVSMALAISGRYEETLGPVAGVAALGSMLILMVRLILPPYATQSERDREAAWVTSLPFEMTGYFESLSEHRSIYCTLEITIEWPQSAPEQSTLLGVIQLHDPSADRLTMMGKARASFRSGKISGSTNMRTNRVSVYRNHRIVKYVHDLVARVLMPIHAEHPIARVTLNRR